MYREEFGADEYGEETPGPKERPVVSVGLELRDYPTLFRAVDGLDAKPIVAAAST